MHAAYVSQHDWTCLPTHCYISWSVGVNRESVENTLSINSEVHTSHSPSIVDCATGRGKLPTLWGTVGGRARGGPSMSSLTMGAASLGSSKGRFVESSLNASPRPACFVPTACEGPRRSNMLNYSKTKTHSHASRTRCEVQSATWTYPSLICTCRSSACRAEEYK